MIADHDRPVLRFAELARCWQGVIATPIIVTLRRGGGVTRIDLKDAAVVASGLQTLSQWYHDVPPPMDLLKQLKRCAKAQLIGDDATDVDGGAVAPVGAAGDIGWPRPVAAMLYYVSIALALVRRKERISRLSDGELVTGLMWASNQPWLDDGSADLLRVAAARLH